ncbi:hypothetical protein CKA32_001616 [Geitlerinema sp. FC II]|nr:hypothetical protein CKA32_001616 [Geitlerinema sp. FC II]
MLYVLLRLRFLYYRGFGRGRGGQRLGIDETDRLLTIA